MHGGRRIGRFMDRGRALLELTGELSRPLTAAQVGTLIAGQGAAATGACAAALWAVNEEARCLELVRGLGLDDRVPEPYTRVALDPSLPVADAVLRAEPIWGESRADYRARYAASESRSRDLLRFDELAFAALPLVVDGRAIAAVLLLFAGERAFDADERAFLTVFARRAR
jgi:hypothetical protein